VDSRALVSVDAIHMQPIPAAACLGGVELESRDRPADEPVEGALRLFITTRRSRWRDTHPDRPRPVACASIGLLGRSWRARRRGDRTRAAYGPESGPSRTSALPSASAELPAPAEGRRGCPVACPLTDQTRWRASRCRTTTSSSNHRQSSWALSSKRSIDRPISISRIWFPRLSPLNRRRYSWMPISPNAHDRGEVNR